MQIQKNNFDIISAAVSILYLLLLTFFLHEGYGVEEDSWGLVLSTFEMHQTHGYVASRLPGHPAHEYLLALLFPPSPFAYNFVSAIFGSLALYFSILFFKNIKTQFPILTGLTLAFTPIVFIANTYTIDYSMSLCFIMLSWYLLTSNYALLAGVALALATGTRITNLYMIVPIFIYLFTNKGRLKDYVYLSFSSSTLSILLFLQVIFTYGINFFDYSDQFPYPNLPKLIYKSTIGVFGLTGMLAFLLLIFKFRKTAFKNVHYAFVVIILCMIAYFRLPQKSAYLIPMIPFIYIIVSNVLHFKMYKWFCGLMILSGWVFGVALVDQARGSISNTNNTFKIKGQEIAIVPFKGNIFLDDEKRIIKRNYTNSVLKKTDSLTGKSAIISGWWYNQLLVESQYRKGNPNTHFVFYCDVDSMNKLKEKGYQLYYLEEQNTYNDLMFQQNVTEQFAKPF